MYGGTCTIQRHPDEIALSARSVTKNQSACHPCHDDLEASVLAVPYCLGFFIKAELENDVLFKAGEFNAAINATAVAQKSPF